MHWSTTARSQLLAQLSLETAELSGELGRPLGLVAESDLNDPRVVEPVAEGGLGMTAQWSDDFHHALHSLLTGERFGYYVDFGDPAVFAKTLTQVFLHDGSYSTFRGTNWGRPVDPARHRGGEFLAYTSNHDQIGNRALGDRPALTPGQLAIGAALVVTSPYTPMLFMGEEWGASTPWRFFTDFDEPALAEAVRTGRRREFAAHGWTAGRDPGPAGPGDVAQFGAGLVRARRLAAPRAARLVSPPARVPRADAGTARRPAGLGRHLVRSRRGLAGRGARQPARGGESGRRRGRGAGRRGPGVPGDGFRRRGSWSPTVSGCRVTALRSSRSENYQRRTDSGAIQQNKAFEPVDRW